jgi:hypothetical protein
LTGHQIETLCKHKYLLVIAAATTEHPGLAFARKGTRSVRQIVDRLELIHAVMTAEEMQGHVEYL